MKLTGLYSGIGGFELGFATAGHKALLLCDNCRHAAQVLGHRWPGVRLHSDVETLTDLPADTEVVTAGFPCQNLSMAGDKTGIGGRKSVVVDNLFRLLDRRPVPWVVIENVYFMLHLGGGAAIASILDRLEARGYSWAYRVVDSRAFGLPQRRRRVFIVASLSADPRNVLLVDDVPGVKWPEVEVSHPIGFYWTEGRSGVGLTSDAIPPLKAGSALAIPCPPAVLLPSGRVVTPPIEALERFQGFPRGWTTSLRNKSARRHRWRLLGNAVSVPVAAWIGRRLAAPGSYSSDNEEPLAPGAAWPSAAFRVEGQRRVARVSEYPVRKRRGRVSAFATENWPSLSERALRGFCRRAREGRLRFPDGFLEAVEKNIPTGIGQPP